MSDHPDAALLQLSDDLAKVRAEQDRLSDEADAFPVKDPRREALWRDVYQHTDRFHEILDQMRDTPALTVDGMRAKARVILNLAAPGGEVPADGDDDRVAWSLAMDVLREPVAAIPDDEEAGFLEQIRLLREEQRRWREAGAVMANAALVAALRPTREQREQQMAIKEAVCRRQARSLEGLIAKAEWVIGYWADKPYHQRFFGGSYAYPIATLEQAVATLRQLPSGFPVAIVDGSVDPQPQAAGEPA